MDPKAGVCIAMPTLPKDSSDNDDPERTDLLWQRNKETDQEPASEPATGEMKEQGSVLILPVLPVPARCGGLNHHFQSCPDDYTCIRDPNAKPEDGGVPALANGICVPNPAIVE